MITRVSSKVASFTESVIREMTRLATAHDAVNLSQGLPDFACPPELKQAVKDAVDADLNQYPITFGESALREAIATKTGWAYPGWQVDPETEICVTCGATEAMVATMLALVEPGDEVIMFEPHYENYGPDAVLAGATPGSSRCTARTGPSTRPSCALCFPSAPGRSWSTPRTTRPARCSAAPSWT